MLYISMETGPSLRPRRWSRDPSHTRYPVTALRQVAGLSPFVGHLISSQQNMMSEFGIPMRNKYAVVMTLKLKLYMLNYMESKVYPQIKKKEK